MHVYIPTLLLELEKEASTIHLSLPLVGFLHLMLLSTLSKFWSSCWWRLVFEVVCTWLEGICLRLALLQPSRRCLALSDALESATCCHNLGFLAFHIHYIMVTIVSIWAVDSCCNRQRWCLTHYQSDSKMEKSNVKHQLLSMLQWPFSMEKFVVVILMGVVTHDTHRWTIDTSASELHMCRETVFTDSPHQVSHFWRYFN